MYDRFTRTSRIGRGKIPRALREEIYRRDEYKCQFCGAEPGQERLTIDHLVPLALGGVDEKTNYVTSCKDCNELKAAMPLTEFAKHIKIKLEALPVHGDPIIDNQKLPIEIRLLRRQIFDRLRSGELKAGGKSYQKKLEKAYRREFWQTPEGKILEEQFPNLPGQVRIMLPEIQAIANSKDDYVLLVELAKSATTRNLIGTAVTGECPVEDAVTRLAKDDRTVLIKMLIEHNA
jgi:hypothetical protein